ncbi:MAG: hypothetical protein KKG78_15295 [Alphaproteobacteria bacterium]|nr:hypothetical protein [Alphaproteobacteria bacterium]
MELFREVAGRARVHLNENKDASLGHNFLSTLGVEVFVDIFQPVIEDEKARSALSVLRLIESLPDHALWVAFLPEVEDEQQAWSALAKGVFLATDHQSQQATDVRWLKLIFLAIIGRMMLPPDFVEELRLYPNHGDMRSVRPKIRAAEMSIRMMESGVEKPESVPQPVTEELWKELFRKTRCVPLPRESQAHDIRDELNLELSNLFDDISEHFFSQISNTHVDARCDGAFGLALYSLSLTYELANLPTQILASGRLLLRTQVELFITLAYLRMKDDLTVWSQFRVYGSGQTALAFLKTSDLTEVPDYVDMDKLEMLANEDVWMECRDIPLGAWSGKNLRKMAEEANVKDVYDRYYDWTSGFVHGHWGAIRDTVFTTCVNPLHRLHRIPYAVQPMPSVIKDCCSITNRILDELNTLYPTFKPRISAHKSDK